MSEDVNNIYDDDTSWWKDDVRADLEVKVLFYYGSKLHVVISFERPIVVMTLRNDIFVVSVLERVVLIHKHSRHDLFSSVNVTFVEKNWFRDDFFSVESSCAGSDLQYPLT